MPQPDFPENLRNKPASDMVEDVMKRSEEALQAGAQATAELQEALRSGAQATAELNEIRRRAGEALDWRQQLRNHKWIPMAGAVAVAVLLYLVFAPGD